MQLRTARLCLDCEEVHDAKRVSVVRVGNLYLHDAVDSRSRTPRQSAPYDVTGKPKCSWFRLSQLLVGWP